MYDPKNKVAQDPCKLVKVYRTPMLPKQHYCHILELAMVQTPDGKDVICGGGKKNRMMMVTLYQEADLKGRVMRPQVFLCRESEAEKMPEKLGSDFKCRFIEEPIMDESKRDAVEDQVEEQVAELVVPEEKEHDVFDDITGELKDE